MNIWRRVMGFVLVGIVSGVSSLYAEADSSLPVPSLSVSLAAEEKGDFISIAARNVLLRTLLTEIAIRAGFQLTELFPVTQTVSLVCRRSPLDVVLKELLQGEGASFMFVYHPHSPHGLQQVVLLRADSTGKGHFPYPPVVRASQPQATACTRFAAEKVEERQEQETTVEADVPLFEVDTSLEGLLASSISSDVQVRASALEALASLYAPDARARQTIVSGMHDPDPYVRSLIIGMLGPILPQWPEAEELMITALSDVEPEVRRHALAVLWDKATPRSNEALTIALQDTDPGIRRRANEFLQEDSLPVPLDQ